MSIFREPARESSRRTNLSLVSFNLARRDDQHDDQLDDQHDDQLADQHDDQHDDQQDDIGLPSPIRFHLVWQLTNLFIALYA